MTSAIARQNFEREEFASVFTNTEQEVRDIFGRFGAYGQKVIEGPMRSEKAQQTVDAIDAIRIFDSKAEVYLDWQDGGVAVATVLEYPGVHYLRDHGREVLESVTQKGTK